MGIYNYKTPDGYGDTFFQYVYDAQDQVPALVNAADYLQTEGPRIADGAFILRNWAGLKSLAARMRIYDWQKRGMSLAPVFVGAGTGVGNGQMVVCPELLYPDRARILLDLINVQQAVAGVDGGLTVYASQVVFSGVRRRPGVVSDPVGSAYRFYEKEYSMQYSLGINNYASSGGTFLPAVQHQIQVNDFDFELRRIELSSPGTGLQANKFKIQLYDTNWNKVSSGPVLSSLLMHTTYPGETSNADPSSSQFGEYSFWPCPPMLYRVNSMIRFDIFSLLFSPVSLPQTFELNFVGVRRIPC